MLKQGIAGVAAFAVLLGVAGAGEAKGHVARGAAVRSEAPISGGGSDYYTNVDGHRVHRPVQANRPPSGWTARCRDGSYSFSENHRGTCSHHGGVSEWR